MTMSNRTFGVEIECIGVSAQVALEAIRAAGVLCEIEYYNHQTRGHWKIVTDASVRDAHGNPGIEVVSPILQGSVGIRELKLVADALNTAGATANKTCGLHVHVGARDLTIDEIKMVVKRYVSHEEAIDAVMPRSRRGNVNTYCKSMNVFATNFGGRLENVTDLYDFENRSWDRFYKLNLAAFVRQGTLEFRQHSGTVQSEKIVNWVLFVLNFIEVSRSMVNGAVSNAPRRGRPAGRSRTRAKGLFKIVDALHAWENRSWIAVQTGVTCRPTVAGLSLVSGYNAASIPACITEIRNRWNLRIRKNRTTGEYYVQGMISTQRYNEILASLDQPTEVSTSPSRISVPTNDQDVFAGLPATVASYFRERAEDLQ